MIRCPRCGLGMTKLDWMVHKNRPCDAMVDDAVTAALMILCTTVGVGAVLAAVIGLFAPKAHADDSSYLGAVSGVYHSVYDNPAMLHFGHGICDDLHSGRSFQQEVEMAPSTMAGYMDVPAVIGAAQHELCPDTLGH